MAFLIMYSKGDYRGKCTNCKVAATFIDAFKTLMV